MTPQRMLTTKTVLYNRSQKLYSFHSLRNFGAFDLGIYFPSKQSYPTDFDSPSHCHSVRLQLPVIY